MAIIIKGDNRGIAVDGNLTIQHLDFQFGQGVKSVSGIRQEIPDAEVVEEIPVVDGRVKAYPEITDVQRNFFETAFVIKGEVYGQRPKVLDMPVEWIMHTIREMTQEWDPAEKTSVHRWKILYMTLLRLEYFRIEKKHRYADFVKAVVKYCFPEVPDSYSNNISKSSLSEHFSDWTVDEKALYNTLKEALTFPK